MKYDAVVVGGSLGGVMAAYALSKQGIKTALIEETSWLGGQLTNQGVPSDEHKYIEFTGATKRIEILEIKFVITTEIIQILLMN